ncbi:uncharacterized protein GLRG_08873 [Colletotrichum graminicola M1.001]|uniref:Uncharacterized protein n=1 Tax=Colletotrichum graminicola (strain M1.001 / M2 / FGSC 10212) TaxID=645133 RepID=E3QSA2_COLGM|nr:uncharacterized protein GLRG_08873 [Colletotrichum graminicola M1.001]EFQ33729.1 hypothetical protein GLRG_08873 [Colletotrichum graminicola M1.001]
MTDPSALRRHLQDPKTSGVHIHSRKFMIDMICGTSTTLQPGGYNESAFAYRYATGASGITIGHVPDHIRMSTLGIAGHHMFENYDPVVQEASPVRQQRIPITSRAGSQTKTTRILFGHGKAGGINWNGVRSLIAAPGFEVRKERYSSHMIALTEKVRAPRLPVSKPSTCIHPPHPQTTGISEDTGARGDSSLTRSSTSTRSRSGRTTNSQAEADMKGKRCMRLFVRSCALCGSGCPG